MNHPPLSFYQRVTPEQRLTPEQFKLVDKYADPFIDKEVTRDEVIEAMKNEAPEIQKEVMLIIG